MTDIVERLRALADINQSHPVGDLWVGLEDAADEIERLRALLQDERCCELLEENLRMRTALEPFAKEADRYEPDEGDDDVRAWGSSFPLCYLRRARDALSSKKAASKETAFPNASA